MGFIDETVNMARETFDAIGKKTDEVISVQKLKLNEKSLKNKIEGLYTQLGKQCYEQYSADNNSAPFAEDLAKQIDTLKVELYNIHSDICKAKGGKCCDECQTFNEQTSAFCKKCGKQF